MPLRKRVVMILRLRCQSICRGRRASRSHRTRWWRILLDPRSRPNFSSYYGGKALGYKGLTGPPQPARNPRAAPSGVAGVGGQEVEVNADLVQRALPLVVERVVEQQLFIGGNGQPGIGLQLGIELPRTPAGIAESQDAA